MKNHQTTFNMFMKIAKNHAGPSVDEDLMTCLYRGPNGAKCLIGEIILDEDYHDALERQPADSCEVAFLMEKYGHDPELCRDVQKAHDSIICSKMDWQKFTKEQWQAELIARLEYVALDWKLEY